MSIEIIIFIIVLFLSVVLHEIGHGYVAKLFGDNTAKYEGRLTLNPQKHIDLFGTIILPSFLHLLNMPLFGYAKPVPVNPYNIRHKYGMLCVSSAGLFVNFVLFLFAFLFLKFGSSFALYANIEYALFLILNINLSLFIFNLIPVPPFDGYKILKELNMLKFIDNIKFENNILLSIFYIFVAIQIFDFVYKYIINFVLSLL